MPQRTSSRFLRALGVGLALLCLLSSGVAALDSLCEMGEGCPMMAEMARPACHQQGPVVAAAADCCAFEGEATLPEPPAIAVSAPLESALPATIGSTPIEAPSASAGWSAAPRERPPWQAGALYTLHSAFLI